MIKTTCSYPYLYNRVCNRIEPEATPLPDHTDSLPDHYYSTISEPRPSAGPGGRVAATNSSYRPSLSVPFAVPAGGACGTYI